MRVAIFSAAAHDRAALDLANQAGGKPRHALVFIGARLAPETANLAAGCQAAAITVHDRADAVTLEALRARGVTLLTLRSKGNDHVDLPAAARLGLHVVAALEYSPHAVAEHAVGLLLALIRHLTLADRRVRHHDFRLDGLLGRELHGRRVGVIGVGRIGRVVADILLGFGCQVAGCDPEPQTAHLPRGLAMMPLDELLRTSEAISLHCPLNPSTRHLIHAHAIRRMPAGTVLVNTSRGAVVETDAIIDALLSGHLSGFATDVLEGESEIFGTDREIEPLHHAAAARLLSMPNVIVTPHQAFLTQEALADIANSVVHHCSSHERELPGTERLVLGI